MWWFHYCVHPLWKVESPCCLRGSERGCNQLLAARKKKGERDGGIKTSKGEVRAGIGSHNPSLSLGLQASSLMHASSHQVVRTPGASLPSTTALNKAQVLAAESRHTGIRRKEEHMKYTV